MTRAGRMKRTLLSNAKAPSISICLRHQIPVPLRYGRPESSISTMDQNTAPEDELPQVTSRPFKRRKFHRKRPASPPNEDAAAPFPAISNTSALSPTVAGQCASISQLPDTEQQPISHPQLTIADILRQRQASQRRRGGIEFTNSTPITESSIDKARHADPVLENEDSFGKILTVVDRFAPQTGQVADVDKHMYAAPKSSMALSECRS